MSVKPLSLLWFLLVVPCIASFVLILNKQFQQRTPETYRLQVLSTRCALFLPVYSFFIFLSLLSPYLFMAYEIFIAIGEGYFFLVFFTLLVENIGGPRKCVVKMEEAQKRIFLGCCCCTNDYNRFFKLVKDALLQFLFVRTIVVLAQAIATYAETSTGTKIGLVLSVVSFLFVVRGFGSLVAFYENVMESSTNINGTFKLLLMKVSVGAIVIQGLIVELLWQTEAIKLKDTSDYTGEERLQRIYCVLVLVEYCLLSVLSFFAFSSEITENVDRGLSTTDTIPAESLGSFLLQVCNFVDIGKTLSQSSDNMCESLVVKQGSHV